MKTYYIKPLPLLSIEIDKSAFTYRQNFGIKMMAPIFSWYIGGGDMHILVDTAADEQMAAKVRGFKTENVTPFEDALARLGLTPEDIGLVIQTHLQWDHCGNTHKCRNAKILVQERELQFALAPHPILAQTYQKSLLKDLRYTILRGHREILPGIELIPAPGHTPGTQAVSINTTQGKAVITGFCSVRENFEPPDPVREVLPVVPPGVHLDAVEAFDTTLYIKSLADIVLPVHEPSLANVECIE
jgi:N-acyl homoserine lactone hydrolase